MLPPVFYVQQLEQNLILKADKAADGAQPVFLFSFSLPPAHGRLLYFLCGCLLSAFSRPARGRGGPAAVFSRAAAPLSFLRAGNAPARRL